ncbi:MAG: hypothetical protein JXM70_17260 [Pirellulales bacterium]|nr:hypothetical protein [Pirellulales bacterium]
MLATQFGTHAVRLVVQRQFGKMVCYHPPSIHDVPIIDAVNELSSVDPEGAAVQAARALGISFGDSYQDEDLFHLTADRENQMQVTDASHDMDEAFVAESV